MTAKDYTTQVKTRILHWGADLVGVTDTVLLDQLKVHPADLLEGFTRAVSIAVALPLPVFDTLTNGPTPLYSNVYQTANRILDELAFKASMSFQKEGYRSLPIPASQVLDRDNWHGAISHKAVARMAGLGWQGKNLLLITPQYGSRVRLVTVLTSAPLEVDSPMQNRCGKCMECRDACPAEAIRGVSTKDHYADREQALYFSRCVTKLTGEFAKRPEIGAPICGICIKVCPFGRATKKGRKAPSDI